MRLLIVTYDYEYPNNMYSAYLKTLAEVADVVYWGPGYSSTEELLHGLESAWDSSKFDALLFDFDLINYTLDDNIDKIYRYSDQNTKQINIAELYRFTNDIFKEALKIQGLKIIHVALDQFYLQKNEEKWLKLMLDNGFFIEWMGKEFFPDFQKERINICGMYATNQGRALVDKYSNRVISNPITAISVDEACDVLIEERKYDMVLPGSTQKGIYDNRIKIIDILKQTNYVIYNASDDRNIRYEMEKNKEIKYLNHYLRFIDIETSGRCPYIKRQISEDLQKKYREKYDKSICQSKIAYADGGNLRTIVHKYFEIPVRGAVLMCQPFYGMEKLGFSDNNMVLVDEKNIVEKIAALLDDPPKMQRIADSGKKFVLEKHTYLERGKCLIRCIESIKNNKFKGSYWDNGEFIIVE